MAEHKIQSSEGDLTLSLRATPKCLSALKAEWCPDALIVSFKLETDQSILMKKVLDATLSMAAPAPLVSFVIRSLRLFHPIVSVVLIISEKRNWKQATGAIQKYGVDFVIANLLQTRNSEVGVRRCGVMTGVSCAGRRGYGCLCGLRSFAEWLESFKVGELLFTVTV